MRPAAVLHAKELGSQRSLCGISRVHWQLFWDMDFSSAPSATRCAECAFLSLAS